MASDLELNASYSSPGATKVFSKPLPSLPADAKDVKQKTAYLKALRSGATAIQAEVNAFLTARMEAEKTANVQASGQASIAGKSTQQEEDMYGEEIVDEDV